MLGAIFAYATIVLGGTVRGMGAGLACDWPLCQGAVVPNLADPLIAVEYAHRLAAALTALFVFLTFVVCVLRFRADRSIIALSFVALAILATQIGFGALTISSRLDWVIVTVHLALGTATFATSTILVSLLYVRFRRTASGAASPD